MCSVALSNAFDDGCVALYRTALTEPARDRLRHVFLPGCARRFFRRNSMNTCSGSGTCRRLG